MECYERYYSEEAHAQYTRRRLIPKTELSVIHPHRLNPDLRRVDPGLDLAALTWAEGKHLSTGATVLVPEVSVLTPCHLPHSELFGGASHGLAAGEDEEGTLYRAVLELIERDAYSHGVLLKRGFEVELSTVPASQRDLIDRFSNVDIESESLSSGPTLISPPTSPSELINGLRGP